MVSTADWTAATRWPRTATHSARDAPVATRSQNARRSAGAIATSALRITVESQACAADQIVTKVGSTHVSFLTSVSYS